MSRINAQKIITDQIERSLKKPTESELIYQRRQALDTLADKCRRLEDENEILKTDNTFQLSEILAMGKTIRSLRQRERSSLCSILSLEEERCRDELVVKLVSKNQQLLNKILWVNAQLGLLEYAYIDQWMEEKTFKALVEKKPKDIPLSDIKGLLDSLREKITEIEKEMMTGIDFSK
jgi:hypothetical protein